MTVRGNCSRLREQQRAQPGKPFNLCAAHRACRSHRPACPIRPSSASRRSRRNSPARTPADRSPNDRLRTRDSCDAAPSRSRIVGGSAPGFGSVSVGIDAGRRRRHAACRRCCRAAICRAAPATSGPGYDVVASSAPLREQSAALIGVRKRDATEAAAVDPGNP